MEKNIPKDWLITGGCGFIGTNLVKYLVDNYECNIRIVDDLSVGSKKNLSKVCNFVETDKPLNSDKVELWIGDVKDEKLAIKATKGIDCIVHLAANTGVLPSIENPKMDCMTNVIGTVNYLEGARINKVDKFILASSGATLGEEEPPIHEEMVPKPISPYGASKLCGEAYCHAYYGSFDINTIALRFGNVYGPYSEHKNSVVAKFIRRAMECKTLEIYGDGEQTRDFIYTEDLVRAIIQASNVNIGGEIFQIATNIELSINKLVSNIYDLLYKQNKNVKQIVHSPSNKGEINKSYSKIDKSRELLFWNPKITFNEGIRKTFEWFCSHKKY